MRKCVLWSVFVLAVGARANGATVRFGNLDYTSFGNWASLPGAAFNYRTHEFTGNNCVNGMEEEQTGTPNSDLTFSLALDNESLKRELGIAADAKALMGVASVSGAAKFLQAATATSLSITLNYEGRIQFANRYFRQSGLSDYALKFVGEPSLFERACGQGFVQQISRGAKLFFSVRFDFSSRDDKDAFAAALHYSTPMASIDLATAEARESVAKRARITISAYQLGGQVEKLAFIFKKGTRVEKGGAGTTSTGFAAIDCSFGDVAACQQALTDALTYASDESNPDSFPNQVDSQSDLRGHTVNSAIANLDYLIVPYVFAQLVDIPGLSSLVEEQKQHLYDLLAQNVDDLNQIDNLENGPIRFTDDQQDRFAAAEQALRTRQAEMIAVARFCYEQDERLCGAQVQKLDQDIRTRADMKFDPNVLLPEPETFGQYCNYAHSMLQAKSLDLPARQSVLAIEEIMSDIHGPHYADLNAAGYFAAGKDAIERCGILDRYLTTLNELDLSYSGQADRIRSLAVIGNLTELQKLSLRDQGVRSADALKNLVDLVELDLSGNQIEDVSPLAGLENLASLRLERNRVRDVSALKNLPSLSLLDVRQNAPELECFTGPVLQECLIARSKWIVQFANTAIASPITMSLMLPQMATLKDQVFLTGVSIESGLNYSVSLNGQDSAAQGPEPVVGKLAFPSFWSAVTAVDDGLVLITGGWPINTLQNMQLYDVTRRISGGEVLMADPRAGHTATRLRDGLVLLAGGYSATAQVSTAQAVASAELIDPKAPGGPRIVQRMEMNSPRAWHTATLLDDGRVLLVGGYVGGRGLSSLEVFDPGTRRFSVVGHLVEGRGGHTLTRLADGRLLVVGGFRDAASAAATAELIDPINFQTRLTRGKLNDARGMHMAQTLPDGEVLLMGGLTHPGDDSRSHPPRDGLGLIDLLSDSLSFARGADGRPLACQSCLNSVEIYLPSDESFVLNPETLTRPRAGAAVVPVGDSQAVRSLRLWGGIDADSAATVETGIVMENPL